MAFRKIDPTPFIDLLPEQISELGTLPVLKWLEISSLVIDPIYQRDVLGTGRKNIISIATDFDWMKFSPVIVAPIGNGLYAIVDAQHRVIAAALRGIKKVPCAVIAADRKKQAAAFAAINAVKTEMSPMQVHAAKLVAGDLNAIKITKACAQACVTICRYPIQAKFIKRGETMSVRKLYQCYEKYGETVLISALCCITKTRDGYPGLIRSQLIDALCAVLEAEPEWANGGQRLLRAMGLLNLREEFSAAMKRAEGSRAGIVTELVDSISVHLDKKFGAKAA